MIVRNITVGSLSELCSILATLLEMEDAKGFSEAEWYHLSIELKKHLSPSVSDQVDHEIWHYLDDLDIRLKDA